MSPASRAPLIKTGQVSQGSQSLALGLAGPLLRSSMRLLAVVSYNVLHKMTTPSYTEPHILTYPVEYLAGIDLYNAGEFHAAHDAWEERWMGPVAPDEKLFLQAMI